MLSRESYKGVREVGWDRGKSKAKMQLYLNTSLGLILLGALEQEEHLRVVPAGGKGTELLYSFLSSFTQCLKLFLEGRHNCRDR